MAKCGRCNQDVMVNEAETCWYCTGWLCYGCWEDYGHCGHPQAGEINERAMNYLDSRQTLDIVVYNYHQNNCDCQQCSKQWHQSISDVIRGLME